jgi:NADP-dependent 3-hydroxy acid dehydrogenase YdfG
MGVLTGRTVMVTGATGALGPAAVAAAAGAGARLVLVGRDGDRLAAVGAPHSGAVDALHVVDLLDRDAVGRLAAETGRSVDAVWHLVGGWRGGSPLPEQPLDDWDWLHDQLVRTTVHVARAFAGALAARPAGRFAAVSSPMALAPTSRNAAYAAAKAGAEATVLALADELTGSPATANVVVVPAIGGRGVPAEEVAETLVFVTSDAAARMNGQRIRLYAGGPS